MVVPGEVGVVNATEALPCAAGTRMSSSQPYLSQTLTAVNIHISLKSSQYHQANIFYQDRFVLSDANASNLLA